MKPISMLDLRAEYTLFEAEIRQAIDGVLESAYYVGGPEVGEFESELAKRVGVKHGIAVSSGTDALLCSLMALGIGPGDEVILPTFTFFATAGSVSRLGATPVFVDSDAQTFNMDPDGVRSAVTPSTKAIIVVHLFGQCADMGAIAEIGREKKIPVIEDAAQAIGASQNGTPACSFGELACLSFYPTKNLGGFGEGGMVLTNRDDLATRSRQMRNHGESRRYYHDFVGGNFRMDSMKAAILLVKLRHLDEFTRRRQTNAEMLGEVLAPAPVTTPHVAQGNVHVYHQYSILCDARDDLKTWLQDHGVGNGVYYPVPLHLQTCFAGLGYREGAFPVAERLAKEIISLPCHPMLEGDDIKAIGDEVCGFYAGKPGFEVTSSDTGASVI